MKTTLMVTVLTYFLNMNMLQAQVTENFNDGDFIANPAWTGDGNQFAINNGQLQLNSSGTDSSYLTTSYGYSGGNYEWDFWLKESFAPSSSNYGRIYLVSNQQNLEGSLNGYFLQFGESGSNDAIELFRQDGTATISLGRGISGQIANSFITSVKVIRDTLGNWKVQTNYSGGTNLSTEILASDNKYLPGSWFGIRCNYTSSNATKFYLDDIYIGKEILDTIPPHLINITVVDSLNLDLTFDEAIISISALGLNNYLITPGIGTPSNIIFDTLVPTKVYLHLANNLSNGITYLLKVNSQIDVVGNINYSDSLAFTYISFEDAVSGDITFTEVMANPTDAPSLPNAEYIEIYNRSNKYLSTKSWQLSDATTTVNFIDDTIAPFTYRAYCIASNVGLFNQRGIYNIKGLSSFPSLNNDGDHIGIKDKYGNELDNISYDLTYYHDDVKSNGGWSIERIDKDFICANKDNWNSSKNTSGGTPGYENSNNGNFYDVESPYLIHTTIIDSLNIRLHFSEELDTLLSKNVNTFIIDNGIGVPYKSYSENYDFSIIHLVLSKPIKKSITYSVTANKLLKDCAGNSVSKFLSSYFGIADTVSSNDIIINEILFNPKPDGNDYVELYNNSTKTIDLNNLKIANADPISGTLGTILSIADESRLLNPQSYLVLTSDNTSIQKNFKINDPRTIIKTNLPSFNDDEGVVLLLDDALKKIDSFHYSEKMHFPLLNDVEGISLERIQPNRPSSDETNWNSASFESGFGTPGSKNSQYFEGDESISLLKIEPEIFSPDNDGEKDNVTFSVQLDKTGYYGSLKIFSSNGAEIKSIAQNELLGNSAEWSWNGITNENVLAKIGIYVLYLQIIHPSGKVIIEKKPFVLGHKI